MVVARLHLCAFYARETFTALVLAALLLVTGCSSKDNYTPNAALAPPPPFMASVQSYGPPVPAEIAMVRMMNSIMPAAGEGFPNAEEAPAIPGRKCLGFTSNEGRVGVGFGGPLAHDNDHGFANLHSGGQMTVQFTFALPSPARKSFSCRSF
ncbi:MAG: hypothetical protein DYH13_11090 [Alphaproteobacteria bacterium PRO2]|nr:hypothetical protein [Alphaproteobacteria bacterium PRO2]